MKDLELLQKQSSASNVTTLTTFIKRMIVITNVRGVNSHANLVPITCGFVKDTSLKIESFWINFRMYIGLNTT